MTDITELAQSLKAAANTTADAIDRLKAFPGDELIDLSQHQGEQVDIDITTLNEWYELSSPANILSLVEALEKAQGMEAYWKTQCRGITDHCEELQAQIDYLQKIAHEQNELATKASNENASLSVMHGKALKHIDSLEKDLVPVYQFIMNNHHKDGYIEWCDCNKQYYETVNEEERRILYSNVGVELQTVPPVTYFENDDAYQCRKWAWQQVKDEVTTEGWTSGDNATYFGFFCWGWDMRRQYNEQRPVTVTAAAADVLAERKRQVTTEGWTPEHDDQHVNFEIAIAGGLYAISAVDSHHKLRNSAPSAWPWDRKWWKPDGPRRDLVKAGALILAEIERLDRAAGIKWEAE